MLTSPHTKAKPYNVGYAPAVDAPSVEAVDDTLMSKEEFFAKLDRAEEDIRQGRYIVLKSKEDIEVFFNR
jgi:hypothetical protein